MSESAIYERVSGIRAELLELIGQVGAANVATERGKTVMQDELIMVANRLGRLAAQLRPPQRPPHTSPPESR